MRYASGLGMGVFVDQGYPALGRVPAPILSVAPMMDRTDRHFRVLVRQLSRHVQLYTEMVTTGAILRGHRARYLEYSEIEHPIALQLGGDDPKALSECVRIAEDYGYDEVNLNVGCPSPRVQKGQFGAFLMTRPQHVALCVSEMKAASSLPITVKHRTGVDALDSYEDLMKFVDTVASAGCDRFSVHARKAWLSGLSPKENRTIPPLRPEWVYRLKRERPEIQFEMNGGVRSLDEAEHHLSQVDSVMIGRWAYDNVYGLAEVDRRFFGDEHEVLSRDAVFSAMMDYARRQPEFSDRPQRILRHLHALFAGQPGARRYRRMLSEWSQNRGRSAGETLPIGISA